MTNRAYVLAPHEDWIVDRFVNEFNADNLDIITKDPNSADVIWLMSEWCWRHLPLNLLRSKKVITTIHHIVPEKFGISDRIEFDERDKITTVYHVPNVHTEAFVKSLTKKPVILIPYWANQKIWKKTCDKLELRRKYGIPIDVHVIGSFQRDTEGHDLKSPKLEKGPDLLGDYITHKFNTWNNSDLRVAGFPHKPYVVLAGWRRQYIISRLESVGIDYTYIEKPPQHTVNELYQTLDEYPITARHEGGPQSLLECGLLNVPVVSRDVGMASSLLESSSIHDEVMFAYPTVPNVEALKLPAGYSLYRELITTL